MVNILDRLPRWNLSQRREIGNRHTPEIWFKQALAVVDIKHENVTMPLDSGAEISIMGSSFPRKICCFIDEYRKQECVGIGENTYMTEGRPTIKITLNRSLV